MKKQNENSIAQTGGAHVASQNEPVRLNYQQMKLALGLHAGYPVVAGMADGDKPQRPQKKTPQRFMESSADLSLTKAGNWRLRTNLAQLSVLASERDYFGIGFEIGFAVLVGISTISSSQCGQYGCSADPAICPGVLWSEFGLRFQEKGIGIPIIGLTHLA